MPDHTKTYHTKTDYSQTTENIRVTVTPEYLEGQSLPEEGFFAWAYRVEIENKGERAVQLINRYWRITDANGHVEEVRGPGVVGEQPILEPGETYNYASWTHLSTSGGLMEGHYEMEEIPPITGIHGAHFTVAIPAFSLDSDEEMARPN